MAPDGDLRLLPFRDSGAVGYFLVERKSRRSMLWQPNKPSRTRRVGCRADRPLRSMRLGEELQLSESGSQRRSGREAHRVSIRHSAVLRPSRRDADQQSDRRMRIRRDLCSVGAVGE
jgi:hypothetical protein